MKRIAKRFPDFGSFVNDGVFSASVGPELRSKKEHDVKKKKGKNPEPIEYVELFEKQDRLLADQLLKYLSILISKAIYFNIESCVF